MLKVDTKTNHAYFVSPSSNSKKSQSLIFWGCKKAWKYVLQFKAPYLSTDYYNYIPSWSPPNVRASFRSSSACPRRTGRSSSHLFVLELRDQTLFWKTNRWRTKKLSTGCFSIRYVEICHKRLFQNLLLSSISCDLSYLKTWTSYYQQGIFKFEWLKETKIAPKLL